MELSSSSREKLLRRVILPAIRGQSCPICLGDLHERGSAVLSACKHAYCEGCIHKWSFFRRKCPLCNADFDSWFSRIDLSSQKFHKRRLPPLSKSSRRFRFEAEEEVEENHPRIVINSVRRRTAPLPWRRSFGRLGSAGVDIIAQRKLQWRESIYDRGLKAVPLTPMGHFEQNISGNNGGKERILRRIEPWIQRELLAILGDPDPSVIVHVATSLYITTLEKKVDLGMGDQFLADLRPFLLEKTSMFWHELRCFAESSFTMETYDSVVEYRQ